MSVAEMFGIPVEYDVTKVFEVESEDTGISTPFFYVNIPSDEDVKRICSRAVLVKAFYRVWAESPTYDGILNDLTTNYDNELLTNFHKDKEWKIRFDAFGRRYTKEEQLERIHKLKVTALWANGKVSMKPSGNAEYVLWGLIENNGVSMDLNRPPLMIYFGIQIAEGNRDAITKFNLQERKYLGTTSMDPELSLVSANMGHVRPGSFVLDPFVGTGSFILISSHFGAQTLGCDIDIGAMRKTKACNLETNFEQLGLLHQLQGMVLCDNSIPPWREVPIIDAIITDPPYGIRAGAKRIGPNKNRRHKAPPEGIKWSFMPQSTDYKVPDVMADLLELAAKMLVIGGKLVYWLPTTPEFKETDLPKHPCLKMISNCLQILTMRWGRRLITMEKVLDFDPIAHDKSKLTKFDLGQIEPQHCDLRDKVFRKGDHTQEKSKRQVKKEMKKDSIKSYHKEDDTSTDNNEEELQTTNSTTSTTSTTTTTTESFDSTPEINEQ
ncbi:hypothetical protein SAMD00019534_103910 [Acytostelium subglobosum LB1]|uniref:hypothetical protein n=1 Tax=Acytostelium subglobosum LB1 TaxID=1410327 RepID=UPI000644AAE1|nr:hypothetical protein SAMD00019534_103910 [Acytostelium subglobosum LB1]GAM27216.1 hypothetical protein SAMD00019534_103910 [Acytostelium subglobosum LB1]|eukprot:XP_012749683.1 hypothetical protein SAMD00019534_103910 [Acytostelium subglobosum LB1]